MTVFSEHLLQGKSILQKKKKKARGPRWPWIAHLNCLDYPSQFFVFLSLSEEFTRISLCLYSTSSPHSLIPCSLTDQNFVNNFLKGSLKEHFYEIISNSDQYCQRGAFFRNFFHVCIVKVAPIHQSHI